MSSMDVIMRRLLVGSMACSALSLALLISGDGWGVELGQFLIACDLFVLTVGGWELHRTKAAPAGTPFESAAAGVWTKKYDGYTFKTIIGGQAV